MQGLTLGMGLNHGMGGLGFAHSISS